MTMGKRVSFALDEGGQPLKFQEEPAHPLKIRRSSRVSKLPKYVQVTTPPRVPSIKLETSRDENPANREEMEPEASEIDQPNRFEKNAPAEAEASICLGINGFSQTPHEEVEDSPDALVVPTGTRRLETLLNSASTFAICENYAKEMLLGPGPCWPRGYNFLKIHMTEKAIRQLGITAFRNSEEIMTKMYARSLLERKLPLINYVSIKQRPRKLKVITEKTEELPLESGLPLDEILKAQVGEIDKNKPNSSENLNGKTPRIKESKAGARVYLGTYVTFIVPNFQTNIVIVPTERARKAVEPIPQTLKDKTAESVQEAPPKQPVKIKIETSVQNITPPSPPSLPVKSAKQQLKSELFVKLTRLPQSIYDVHKSKSTKPRAKEQERAAQPSYPGELVKQGAKAKIELQTHKSPTRVSPKTVKESVKQKTKVLNNSTPLSTHIKPVTQPVKPHPPRRTLPLPYISYDGRKYKPAIPVTFDKTRDYPILSIRDIPLKTKKAVEVSVPDVSTTTTTPPVAVHPVSSEAAKAMDEPAECTSASASSSVFRTPKAPEEDDADVLVLDILHNEFDEFA